MFLADIDLAGVHWEQVAAGLLGLGLLAKGILDGYAKRFGPGPEAVCNFTAEDKRKLDLIYKNSMDLHDMYGNGGSIDPRDGVPRAFSRDLQRDTLELLRAMQLNCQRCGARLGVLPDSGTGKNG